MIFPLMVVVGAPSIEVKRSKQHQVQSTSGISETQRKAELEKVQKNVLNSEILLTQQ